MTDWGLGNPGSSPGSWYQKTCELGSSLTFPWHERVDSRQHSWLSSFLVENFSSKKHLQMQWMYLNLCLTEWGTWRASYFLTPLPTFAFTTSSESLLYPTLLQLSVEVTYHAYISNLVSKSYLIIFTGKHTLNEDEELLNGAGGILSAYIQVKLQSCVSRRERTQTDCAITVLHHRPEFNQKGCSRGHLHIVSFKSSQQSFALTAWFPFHTGKLKHAKSNIQLRDS